MGTTNGFVNISGKEYYKIGKYNEMQPFFITLPSNSDVWMFLSSNGGLCAGRRNSEYSLFPYETEDKIHDKYQSGPKTLIRITAGEQSCLWEPFVLTYANKYDVTRNMYKSVLGNSLIFEEVNESLGLTFSYQWEMSERYGIVRTSTLKNDNDNCEVEILDGILNILPADVNPVLQENRSSLVDAYKSAETDDTTGITTFSLVSKINDTPDPQESLHANVAWFVSQHKPGVCLTARVFDEMCSGGVKSVDNVVRGQRCCFILHQKFALPSGESTQWRIVLDADLSQVQVDALAQEDRISLLNEDLVKSDTDLRNIVAIADGLQQTADKNKVVNHYNNVLFNNMRGGVFIDAYSFDFTDLISFVQNRNVAAYSLHKDFWAQFETDPSILSLKKAAQAYGNSDVLRLAYEYLPLSFSRRHGDPSRPWNRFNIEIKSEDGTPISYYEGNWRDIFQNWEAMCLSYPEYIDNMVVKFLNASTADGFNPYRISKNGIDWEKIEPEDPFSSLGYWGDHQIIYLTKLLEIVRDFSTSKLASLVNGEAFSYADLPYVIKPYADIVANSKDTIIFDHNKDVEKEKNAAAQGSDAKLLWQGDSVYAVSFAEKLLVPILAKLSNLVMHGGIWMNTQRPEWNDANNAIVGNGLSVVTVCHLRRHISLSIEILDNANSSSVPFSSEVLGWLLGVKDVFEKYTPANINAVERKGMLDELGAVYGEYRKALYENGLHKGDQVSYADLQSFLKLALSYVDATISSNKREDGLYNAYNLLALSDNKAEVKYLYPMLEGQTAILNSLMLSSNEVLELVSAMESSGLYSAQHRSFYLYPISHPKSFKEKNIISSDAAGKSQLIQKLLSDKNTDIVQTDSSGNIRFHGDFSSENDLLAALDRIEKQEAYTKLVQADRPYLREIYEQVFHHSQFTGRSGVMYKYEGVGCIYWHQNSKFILGVQESFYAAKKAGEDANVRGQLKQAYYQLRSGLGFNKTPEAWGGFPIDPYSHTSYSGIAQQPGMTGQVKEDILARRGELGLSVHNGELTFDSEFILPNEILENEGKFDYIDVSGAQKQIALPSRSLAFTLCQIPVTYIFGSDTKIEIEYSNGNTRTIGGTVIDAETSNGIFDRSGAINAVKVFMA
ncbi:hypothetical protein [Paenibacillus sp. MMS18-CY102]|uniref:hypothetical protein n=1 Tax=Paenibacillus sp. MMS18-CY102 TaxID=2682849 RepID=UPI00136662E4|nr:hypothetical protein [Paenibacillus sp. MMS18-CY102]MWC29149.1 hypothetical protein [Paenibacillus sp. MMS18-CY102]